MTTLNETIDNMKEEQTPVTLTDFVSQGPWEGWFRGVIQKEYQTNSGYTFRTEDNPAREGKRGRNLRLAVTVTNKTGDERNVNGIINYDPNDLAAQRVTQVREAVDAAKTAYAEAKSNYAQTNGGSSKGFTRKFSEFLAKDINTTQLSYRRLGGLQAAVKGFTLAINGTGGLTVDPLFGEAVDVKLRVDQNGYSAVDEIAPAKSHRETRY